MTKIELSLEGPATVVVAWRSGKRAHGRALKAGGDVTDHLRRYAASALEHVRTGQGRAYDPNDEQDDECTYLEADRSELLDTELLEQTLQAASLPQATTDDLQSHPLALYALVVGEDPNALTAFVRKGNPVKFAKKGLVAIFDQTLTRVEQPLLTFDERYDAVIYPGNVHILNQANFEALFKESEAVLARTSEWARSLAGTLPMSTSSMDWLATRLRQTSVMRRRVQSILSRSYLHQLTPEVLCVKMKEHGLDPQQLMDDDGLIINKDTERDVVLLLNEDLWTGDFSGERYAATRKAQR